METLAAPVLAFVLELIKTLQGARTTRDAARAAIALGFKRLLRKDNR